MSHSVWHVTFQIRRQRSGQPSFYEAFALDVDPDEYILDVIERIWAQQDRSLTFRHACHHSTCGACGMRINGAEKLTCITTIHNVTNNGGSVRVEPLRNFPILSDLVVDMSTFFQRMEQIGFRSVATLHDAQLPFETPLAEEWKEAERLVDCIECGLCISACPISDTTSEYLGPAVLAGAQDGIANHDDTHLFNWIDHENGVWRCHSAFECSSVCPSNVDPGWRIMNLRKRVIGHRVKGLFSLPKNSKHEK